MSKSKETIAKKQQDDLASSLQNLPWALPYPFPSMPPFGSFSSLPIPPPLPTAPGTSATNNFSPYSLPSLMSNNSSTTTASTNPWSNNLSTSSNATGDYNDYAKQLGFLLNVLNEQQQQQQQSSSSSSQVEPSKSSSNNSTNKSTKSKQSSSTNTTKSSSSSSESHVNNKNGTSSSHRSKSSSSGKSHPNTNSSTSKSSTTNTNESTSHNVTSTPAPLLDPLSLTSTFPYFLPPFLTPSGTTNPFSNLSTSLLNPTASLYPFLSPDWFTSTLKTSTDVKESIPSSTESSTSKTKKRPKSNQNSTNEQNSQSQLHQSALTNPSLLQSALNKSTSDHVSPHLNSFSSLFDSTKSTKELNTTQNNGHVSQDHRPSSSTDDDESDPNAKRRKTEEVNENLVRIPLNTGWKRVTIIRAITKTGVRGDVSYFAPCGRKLRSFQEIDRYLTKKKMTNLDRANFTFSSKVHIGHFHQPKEGPDGKVVFQEFTENEIVDRILKMNPKFRQFPCDLSGETSTSNEFENSTSNVSNENKKKRDSRTSNNETTYPHHEFLKAMIEQQKFLQQQELEQQQEQERKRQEIAFLKQMELKKRQEEKLMLIEQRKAEKTAEREKKIQEKCTEMVLAREMKRIAEDLILRDLKPLPTLTPVENSRISIDVFANALMIVEFLQNFKEILQIPENFLPTLNNLSQMNFRDMNSLCQHLLRLALEDPGIPNPKKALTHLGQKLSEIDITEHTFSEILRIYIRERNGFDEKITQSLSDTSFQSLSLDDKIDILAFLCNDLSTSKRIVDETDRHLDELIALKHEKLEMEKRLRRLKIDKTNQTNGKKFVPFTREKDLNSSDNESPDESDSESMQIEKVNSDPMTTSLTNADDQDVESIDDLDQRLNIITKQYVLIKRRVIGKQCRARALHLGQDRYRRNYWYFSHQSAVYVEGLRTGDISSDDLKEIVDQVTKQRFETTNENQNNVNGSTTSRLTTRKRQQTKLTSTKVKNEPEEETIIPTNSTVDDPATMDLSAFCHSTQSNGHDEIKVEPMNITDENQPLDLTCSKSKRTSSNNDQHNQVARLLPASIIDLTPTVSLLSNIKQENILNFLPNSTIKEDPKIDQFKQIEQSIREKFQFAEAQPIPDDVQSGWWIIQTADELKSLIRSLTRRGERERYLCRMLQRYFDVITHSMTKKSETTNNENETIDDEQQASSSNDFSDQNSSQFDDRHEMDILTEIYNLSERILSSNFQSRSFDVEQSRLRLTFAEIQAKGSEILDEAKHLLLDLERHIERRYLKPPFVRKSELNASVLSRIPSTNENLDDENSSNVQHDEVPQQLERWRRTVNECRTPAQLALCLTQLDRCIAWERSIMRVFCEICNSDDDEEKLLLCDGCDHGSHTYCFRPPMSGVPPNDWFCFVCIGKAKGENLCFVCGTKGDQTLNRCDQCSKLFHDDCLKNAKQSRGKWLCVLCAANDPNASKTITPTKPTNGRQTIRSANCRQSSNGDAIVVSSRSRTTNSTRKTKTTNSEVTPVVAVETQSNSSSDDETTSSTVTEPIETNPKKKTTTRSTKTSKDIKTCRTILNELLESESSWPFHNAVDPKEHPEYYECVKEPMNFMTIKKKLRTNQYKNRDEFSHDVDLILNNCEFYNEDESPVGQAGHKLRKVFQTEWKKQFG